jgi:catalase
MFAYPDAARYRLGVNYQQLPTNRSKAPVYTPYQRDGYMNFSDNYGADPNYVGSTLKPTTFKPASSVSSTITEHEKWIGEVTSFTSQIGPEDYEQATALWNVLGREPGHQERFIGNLAGHLSGAKTAAIRNRVYGQSNSRF